MKIKVLGISTSPRKNGNSVYLLEKALEGAQAKAPDKVETELYKMSAARKYLGCVACMHCVENQGVCAFKDKDDTQELIEKFIEADVVIYSTPVYHMGLPGRARNFIERLGMQVVTSHNLVVPRLLKVIGCIAQGDCIFSGQETCIMEIIRHSIVMGCVYVSGAHPECYVGAGGWTAFQVTADSMQKLAEEDQRLEAVGTVKGSRSVGVRAVEMASLLKCGAAKSREFLEEDPEKRTYENFFRRAER